MVASLYVQYVGHIGHVLHLWNLHMSCVRMHARVRVRVYVCPRVSLCVRVCLYVFMCDRVCQNVFACVRHDRFTDTVSLQNKTKQ